MSGLWQRLALAAVAVVVGWMSLPLSARVLDQVAPALVLPVALLAATAIAAGAGALLRRAAGPSASRARGAALGAGFGLVGAVVSYALLFILIAGLPGGPAGAVSAAPDWP